MEWNGKGEIFFFWFERCWLGTRESSGFWEGGGGGWWMGDRG